MLVAGTGATVGRGATTGTTVGSGTTPEAPIPGVDMTGTGVVAGVVGERVGGITKGSTGGIVKGSTGGIVAGSVIVTVGAGVGQGV